MTQPQTKHIMDSALDIASLSSQELIVAKNDVYEKFSLSILYLKDAMNSIYLGQSVSEETKKGIDDSIKAILAL